MGPRGRDARKVLKARERCDSYGATAVALGRWGEDVRTKRRGEKGRWELGVTAHLL